jgi:hypothetical protein
MMSYATRYRGRTAEELMKRWFTNNLTVLLVVALGSVVVSSQAPSSQPAYTPPKTPWGDPDLQGIWPGTDMVGVPFERPERFGTRLYLTDAELTEREQQAKKQQELDVLDFDLQKPPAEIVALGDVGGVTSPPPHWLERGVPSRQSSLVVQPANGRMPAMTPEGTARQKSAGGTYAKQTGFASASELGPYDRCISRGVVGSMMPVVYNNGNEIVQGPGFARSSSTRAMRGTTRCGTPSQVRERTNDLAKPSCVRL